MMNSNSNELQHYGVLGMKWGIRRYQNKDGSLTPAGERHRQKTGETGYHYKSWGTKHNEKLAAKYEKKVAKAKTDEDRAKFEDKRKKAAYRAERSRELDRREQAYADSVSTKEQLLRSLGTRGSKSYQQFMAMMNVTDKTATGRQKYMAYINAWGGGRIHSTLVKSLYLRSGGVYGHDSKSFKERYLDEVLGKERRRYG